MCLITIAPKGKSKDINKLKTFIENGMSSNTDGSGFMYKREGTTTIGVKKGFFKSNDIIEAIENLNLKDNDELVIHHRNGTSGKASAENTHPFYLHKNHDVIVNTNALIEVPAYVHNGIMTLYQANPDFSDTYSFVSFYLGEPEFLSLLQNKTPLFEDIFSSIIKHQKLAFLFPERDLLMLGNFIEDDGYYHSNTGYKFSYYDRGGWGYEYYTPVRTTSTTSSIKEHSDNVAKEKINNKNKLKDILKFDNEQITLNSLNYDHFKFIHKRSLNDVYFIIEDYKMNDVSGITLIREDLPTSRIQTNWYTFIKTYYYIPKDSYKEFYEQYMDLELNLNKSKNTLKKINKFLSQQSIFKKKGGDIIDYKGLKCRKDVLSKWYSLNSISEDSRTLQLT